MRVRHLWMAVGITGAIVASGCGDRVTNGAICDGEVTNYGADVVDSAKQPVTGLAISDSVAATGMVFAIVHAEERPGHYVIMSTDTIVPRLEPVTTTIIVRGTGGSKSFSQPFIFGMINSCVWGKLAGPDTIVAR